MKVDFTFDRAKVERQGYTVDAVHQTIKQHFAAKGLRCVEDGRNAVLHGQGRENDFSGMWGHPDGAAPERVVHPVCLLLHLA